MLTGNVLMIVLTGGPCAGKTSALSQLMEWLIGLGYRVAIVPEAATELIMCGIRPTNFQDALFFQKIILGNICNKEELFIKAVSEMMTEDMGKPAILLCDRGIMDAQAYVGQEVFQRVLREERLDLAKGCDKRYAGIIHLRTAADGAEEYYTLANNSSRTETPEQARALDRATEEAWHGHHRLIIVDNSTTFAEKILRTQQAVSSILGIPSPTEFEKKFIFEETAGLEGFLANFVKVEIEQFYLKGGTERVRKKTRHGASTFFHTIKENRPGLERIKIDRIISEREFFRLLRRKDPLRGIVKKTRTHFVHLNQYFELDHFRHNGLWLLEVRPTQQQQEVILPPFLPETTDVTNDPYYYNYNIAALIAD